MAQQMYHSKLECPNCRAELSGVLIDRGGVKEYEATPALLSPTPDTGASTTAADEENDDPNTASGARPTKKKKKERTPPVCATCRDLGLTTPLTTTIGSKKHNLPCPLKANPPEGSNSAPTNDSESNTARDPYILVGSCTSASAKTRGPREALAMPC
jgi:hypothetical protein